MKLRGSGWVPKITLPANGRLGIRSPKLSASGAHSVGSPQALFLTALLKFHPPHHPDLWSHVADLTTFTLMVWWSDPADEFPNQ